MLVKEIMSESPACCTSETGLSEVAKLMVTHNCGCIPVLGDAQDSSLVGMVTDRDMVVRALAEGKDLLRLKAKDVMSSPVCTVTPDASVEDCCNLMEERQIRRVAVVDNSGKCCGMVAQADIALNAGKQQTGEVVQKVSE